MLSKHFAVLGTTGVGKSSGVALILQQILDKRPNLRIFLLDGHNEYARCFGERAHVLNPKNVKLPFWLFNFEETIDILYGGRGDDDMIGGPGINDLYAWTQDPQPPGDNQFGVFVDPANPDGPVFDDNGAIENSEDADEG